MSENENLISNAFELYILLEKKRKDRAGLNIESCFDLSGRISGEILEETKKQDVSLVEGNLVDWSSKVNISDTYSQLDKNFSYMADAIGLVLHLEEDESRLLDIWSVTVKDLLLLYLSLLEENKKHMEDIDPKLDMNATYEHEVESHYDNLVDCWGSIVEILPDFKQRVLKLLGEELVDMVDHQKQDGAIVFINKLI